MLILEPSTATINVWNDVLAHVEKRLNANVFDTWFRRITFDGFDPETRTINLIAADITKDWVIRYYSTMIDEILGDMGLDGYQLEWDLDEQPTHNLNEQVESEAENHDRALRVLPTGYQLTGQLAMMLVMVGYTFTGLYLLFGG